LKVIPLNRRSEDFHSRMFLRLFAWYLSIKSQQRDAYSAWDSALWTTSLFASLLSLAILAALATAIGAYLHVPPVELTKFSRPGVNIFLAVFAPVLLGYYLFLRSRFRDFRQHPEVAEGFGTPTDRVKLLALPIGFTLAFLGLEGFCGYLLR
jgi:hypothetical protein